jgi:hypothetical protein
MDELFPGLLCKLYEPTFHHCHYLKDKNMHTTSQTENGDDPIISHLK